MASDAPIESTLQLARDLCLGVGAFFVTPAGTVFSDVSDVMLPEDAERWVAALGRSCLAHPAAHGTGLFWSAESAEETEARGPDSSLACVVAPIWSGSTWLGLLGVVDIWVPELDEEQRAGLLSLAADLARRLASEEAEAPTAPGAGAGRAQKPASVEVAARAWLSHDVPPAAQQNAPHLASTSEPFLGEVLDNLPEGLVVTRTDGTIVLVNQTFSAITGLEMDAVLGEDISAVAEPTTAERGGPTWSEIGSRDPGRVGSLEQALGQDVTGTLAVGEETRRAPLHVVGRRIQSRFAGDCFVTLVRNIQRSDRPQMGIELFLDTIEDGIVCVDASGTIVVANRAARRLQGVGPDEMQVGHPFPATGLRTKDDDAVLAEHHPLLRSMRDDVPVDEDLVLHEDDTLVHVAVSARPLRVDGGDGAIAVLRDVTAERERQEHLTHYALHDPLTGVANRYLLNDALGRMLDGLVRRGGSVALIYLDLDDFKAINDRHGHEIGDEVLRAVARRLERAVRGEDVVARIGGDEFVIAHVSAERLSDGDTVVARIRKILSAPYRFGDLALEVRASVGWVSTSTGGETPGSLISRADRAMYERKRGSSASVEDVVA